MTILFTIILSMIFLVLLGILFWQVSLLFACIIGTPIVYSNSRAVEDAFRLAGLKNGETVIDLGCGNARTLIIAAKKFGAKGIGVDRSVYCFLKSNFNIWLAGERKNIKIVLGSFEKIEKNLKSADVVYFYLLNTVLQKIEPWFFKHIGPKTRVVSLSFVFAKNKPVDEAKTMNLGQETRIRLYHKS
jgi:hypothetical protein